MNPSPITPEAEAELDKILKRYTAPKNVKDQHGNVYYDFTFKEAKQSLTRLLVREQINLVDTVASKYVPISLSLNEYPQPNVLAYNEFGAKVLKNLEFLKAHLESLLQEDNPPIW